MKNKPQKQPYILLLKKRRSPSLETRGFNPQRYKRIQCIRPLRHGGRGNHYLFILGKTEEQKEITTTITIDNNITKSLDLTLAQILPKYLFLKSLSITTKIEKMQKGYIPKKVTNTGEARRSLQKTVQIEKTIRSLQKVL